ncbi:MAG: sensor histidine kinase [Sphingomonas bacterium]|nr:sensor histidine kinase [Sphingomonas bacterium]
MALFPLGLALAWTARAALQDSQRAVLYDSNEDGKVAARMIDGLIARNALALRIAVNAGLRTDAANPCPAISQSLALTPSVATRFAVRGDDGELICVHGAFVAGTNNEIVAPGALRAWINPIVRSVRFRVGVNGGMATGELTAAELDRAMDGSGSATVALSIRDQAETLIIRAAPERLSSTRLANYPIAGGQLTAMVRTRLADFTLIDRLSMFLPLLMWVVAALLSWLLVRRLLLVPLARLERAVSDYQPGEGALVLPERLGAADEIRSLGAAFERAVDRLENSEQQMAEALHGQRRLVREVHHRVKNNLQVIASLLSIHGRSATAPESRAAYAAIGRRVDALSVVHRNHFAEVEESRGIALRPLLTELGQILRASAPETAAGASIHLDADSLHTTQDAAVAVAFFVTELIEFAMLQGAAQPIEIELKRVSELAASLTVSSDALVPTSEEPGIERIQFERVITGLSRQLRSPLEQKLGRVSVNLPVFPD